MDKALKEIGINIIRSNIKSGDCLKLTQEDGESIVIHANTRGITVTAENPELQLAAYRNGRYQVLRAAEIPKEDERFGSRGIGTDNVDCFVCGTKCRICFNNISGFVTTQESGQRIVDMFQYGARLDFRPSEPSWIQVKIGACKQHAINLELLNQVVKDGFINKKRIKYAIQKNGSC